ncbi:MAG TPA: PadR family transcriptional regulator [Chloroflexota bacterium]|jgi:DNA-binding PadR family transcriptional regulator
MFNPFFARHRRAGRGFGPFDAFGAEWQEAWGGWGPFGGRGGPGPRVDRGDVKLLILSVLRDGPKHGYEIMRAIEQRTGAAYTPSPGTVYPTLQMLEDLGHVQAQEGGERKVYALTDAGRAYLDEHGPAERDAWTQFERHPWRGMFPGFGTEEQRQLRDELFEMGRALFAGGRIFRADAARLTRIREILRGARQQIEAVFADYV